MPLDINIFMSPDKKAVATIDDDATFADIKKDLIPQLVKNAKPEDYDIAIRPKDETRRLIDYNVSDVDTIMFLPRRDVRPLMARIKIKE